MKITFLNTSILTNYGIFEYSPITLGEAQKIVKENEVQSAIGHSSTAEILSEYLMCNSFSLEPDHQGQAVFS